MSIINASTTKMEEVEIVGIPALYTPYKVSRQTVHLGMYCYELQAVPEDWGQPRRLMDEAGEGFFGTVLTPIPVEGTEGDGLIIGPGGFKDELGIGYYTPAEFEEKYLSPYTNGTFGPEKDMSRSEAAAIFARLLADRLDERIPSGSKVKFHDIAPSDWYAGYVQYLTGYGIAVGHGDGTYQGERPITRAEFTAMAVRFFDVYGDGAEDIMEQYDGFNDVTDGHWAAEYIRDAAIHGWVEGYGDGTFRADDPIDRAEVVTIVNRLLGREADEDYIADNRRRLVTFPDVSPRHWAYYDVLEAANAHTALLTDPESWER